ncbi:MAG TPA: hypothetical protein VNH11_23385 [Pirellulales bacterium]|nr:hypothetical protein [Pirellulales bacterium]
MARAASTEGKTKSDTVRDYLKINSSASVAQIVDDLRPYGISTALAQKIKYDKGRERSARPARARRARAHSNSRDSGRGAKADAIREVAQQLEKPIRPRDVIAALGARGVTVSYAQVGQVLKGMGMRRKKRRKGGRRAATARTTTAAATPTPGLSLEALLAAKKLADQLGGVQAAKQAMDAIAKLS